MEDDMGTSWNVVWLTTAFLSELAALAALASWGWTTGSGWMRALLVIGAPVAAAVLWGLVAAPHAAFDVPVLAVVVKLAVFGAAVAALVSTGHPVLAVALALAAAAGSFLSTAPEVSVRS
jgi:hypothetical protein